MDSQYEIIDINANNVDEFGLFCLKSKKKSIGYQNKIAWIKLRFSEGLKYKVLRVLERNKMTQRGFIEYMPSELAWRGIKASNYLTIHCLWVVGKFKKMGYGSKLLDLAIEDAKKLNKNGLLALTTEKPFLTSEKFYLKRGFEIVKSMDPYYKILRLQISGDVSEIDFENPYPQIQNHGFTVYDSDQCPYSKPMVNLITELGTEMGVKVELQQLGTRDDIRKNISPCGSFGIAFNGEHLTYYNQSKDRIMSLLKEN